MSSGRSYRPSGLPGSLDGTKLQLFATSILATAGLALDDLYIVQPPQPVPQGKHWIVTAAMAMAATNPSGSAGSPGMAGLDGMYIINPKALPAPTGGPSQSLLAGLAANGFAFLQLLVNIQAVGVYQVQAGTGVPTASVDNSMAYSLAVPYIVIPSGCALVAFFQPPNTDPNILSLSFEYFQRDNVSCECD